MKGKLFILSGPSGVGKGTVIKEFLKRNKDFKLSVISYADNWLFLVQAERSIQTQRKRQTKVVRNFIFSLPIH